MTKHAVDQGSERETVKQMVPDALWPELPLDAPTTRVFVSKTLKLCCNRGAPEVLCIVDYLIDEANYRVQLETLRKRLMAPRPAAPHPLEATILQSGLPFANREPLRGMLRSMIEPNAFRPILQISGETGSGKSWTYFLIQHFCATDRKHIPCYYAVNEESGPTAGPREVANDLVAQLGSETSGSPEQTANLDAYADDLAHWVIGHANTINGRPDARVWFVFDGFCKEALRPDTAKFLAALARLCTSGLNAERHRVVFCEFDYTLSTLLRMHVSRYQTEPITRDDVRTVIRAQTSLHRGLAPAEIDSIVETLTDRVVGTAQEPFEDLTVIGEKLLQTVMGAQIHG